MITEKIVVDTEFLNDIISKGWLDIENLQSQIASLSNDDAKTAELKKLLNNLLTSYYVFTGCVENLVSKDFSKVTTNNHNIIPLEVVIDKQAEIPELDNKISVAHETTIEPIDIKMVSNIKDIATMPKDDFEPFEYFVDFDEPVGEKLTDEDLY